MSELKATPGPWEVGFIESVDADGIHVNRFSVWGVGGYKLVCEYTASQKALEEGTLKWREKKSDAHLIAAAPEMYEELRALAGLEGILSNDYLKKLSQVLAKARGEEQ